MTKIASDYITCALWASNDANGTPLDSGDFDLSPEASATLEKQANDFEERFPLACQLWETYGFSPGHDLWLSRNGAGTGFWDRTIDEYKPGENQVAAFALVQNALDRAAKELGEVNLYVGDDGLIYIM